MPAHPSGRRERSYGVSGFWVFFSVLSSLSGSLGSPAGLNLKPITDYTQGVGGGRRGWPCVSINLEDTGYGQA